MQCSYLILYCKPSPARRRGWGRFATHPDWASGAAFQEFSGLPQLLQPEHPAWLMTGPSRRQKQATRCNNSHRHNSDMTTRGLRRGPRFRLRLDPDNRQTRPIDPRHSHPETPRLLLGLPVWPARGFERQAAESAPAIFPHQRDPQFSGASYEANSSIGGQFCSRFVVDAWPGIGAKSDCGISDGRFIGTRFRGVGPESE